MVGRPNDDDDGGRLTMTWWLSAAAEELRNQVNYRYPHRDKASDGTIGDPRHAKRGWKGSQHNPNPTSKPAGVVRALDLDADLTPIDTRAAWRLADSLRLAAKNGDRRILYIVFDGRITSRTYPWARWKWRVWSGDPHRHHIHVSFTEAGDHDGRPFAL
jgi:hypothetical protein